MQSEPRDGRLQWERVWARPVFVGRRSLPLGVHAKSGRNTIRERPTKSTFTAPGLFLRVRMEGLDPQERTSFDPPVKVRDPDDAIVLATAIEAGGEVLVTGDDDLLILADQVETLQIVSPRTFWENIRSS